MMKHMQGNWNLPCELEEDAKMDAWRAAIFGVSALVETDARCRVTG